MMAAIWLPSKCGEPFVPTLVVEIDALTGSHSNLSALHYKMRREVFPARSSIIRTSGMPQSFDACARMRGEISMVAPFFLDSHLSSQIQTLY